MSEDSKDLFVSAENDRVGPDYFGYYKQEVIELLSHDEDFLPFDTETSELCGREYVRAEGNDAVEHNNASDSLFGNVLTDKLSEFKRERLKRLLRQAVIILSSEVDEMVDPVEATSRLQVQLRSKKRPSRFRGATSKGDTRKASHKKHKVSSSSSITGLPQLASTRKPALNDGQKNSSYHNTEITELAAATEEPQADDLQFFLDNNSSQVEETVKTFSNEISTTLVHMERQLEELLDNVTCKCRRMTLAEKQQLRRLIQGLEPECLDRVAEIIQGCKPKGGKSSDELFVDLDKENNVTLWRLYYYIKTVEERKTVQL